MKKTFLILSAILILASALRLYKLGEVPPGFHQDEVSQAYNAFSILNTGMDRYGEPFPILFRSFGSYQPPVYTYLTPVFIFLFGNTIFAARFTSAFFGILVVALTYFIVLELINKKYRGKIALISAFVVSISPWAIHFSRRVVEGNLGLFFFLLSFYLFLRSLKNIKLFPLAAFVLGVATHAYYSERVLGVIFLPLFVIYFRKYFLKNIKFVILGVFIFGLTLVPHIITILSGAFAARFAQVKYSGSSSVLVEFLKHYISYFSPKNLFSDIGSNLGRVSPGLGVFYSLFFVPFLVGIYSAGKLIDKKYLGLLGLFLIISLIPVGLTGDVFYPLRALEFFWILSLVISIGIFEMFSRIKFRLIRVFLSFALSIFLIGAFYVSYFVLFKYESTENVGLTYVTLSEELRKYDDYSIVIDAPRDPAAGLRIAYFRNFDPRKLQEQLRPQMETPYYSGYVNQNEQYRIDNITVGTINWGRDRCAKKTILVGDNLSFSDPQIKQHNLTKVFEIESLNKDFILRGYNTNPDKECL